MPAWLTEALVDLNYAGSGKSYLKHSVHGRCSSGRWPLLGETLRIPRFEIVELKHMVGHQFCSPRYEIEME